MIISVSHFPLHSTQDCPSFTFNFRSPSGSYHILLSMSTSSLCSESPWVSSSMGLLIRGSYGCTHEEYGPSQASLFPIKTSLSSQFLKFENNAVLPTPWQRPLDWMFSCPAMKRLA